MHELKFVSKKMDVDEASIFCYTNNMATRILVKPIADYFVAFLSTRGVHVVDEDVDVIHYFGDSKRKLKKLVVEYNPDLVVLHNAKAFDLDYKFPFALDEIHCDKDIYIQRQINTNALELTKLHYRSLGLERILHDCGEKKKQKLQINANAVKKIFTACETISRRFSRAMMWE